MNGARAQQASVDSAARDHSPVFVALEGLRGVGKTTVGPLLADALGAIFLPTVRPGFAAVREFIDSAGSPPARMHFWMMANYVASDDVRRLLAEGRSVVVESYVYRSLATHAAIGVSALPSIDWRYAVQPDVAVLITLDENVRRQRLRDRERSRSRSRWAELEESHVEAARCVYESFNLTEVDVTGKPSSRVVDELVAIVDRLGATEDRLGTAQVTTSSQGGSHHAE